MSGTTRPTGEQLRFRSQSTGDHILDAYLEAAERGGRTLPDMLADIFDSGTGIFRTDLFEFRMDDDQLQFRVGDFPDETSGWQNVPNGRFFEERFVHVGPTPPADTTKIWFDTN